MDGLDLLKQHWKDNNSFPKIQKNELQAMLHKSSSSIVKWIFTICCVEFIVWITISIFIPAEREDFLFFQVADVIYNVVFYAFIFFFIYQFYTLLIRIKNTSNTRKLIESILAVRTNAHNYIRFNLIAAYAAFGIQFIQLIVKEYTHRSSWGEMIFVLVLGSILFTLFGFLFIWLFKLYFKILYGILLKKLNSNYDELIRLEENET
ncbi:hypothetical protein [Sphingobacterium faecale]|uniref:Uncharacterized protein n=1 Tax=Sphingobacterium faecale TaxID=2803775 RepID=A0ABS1R6W2_9SPHI|nr:hypothetical protein [Sphingobacterium faecale]MBL1409601.1 hypothetical protein [Sphingobacterium faecale]